MNQDDELPAQHQVAALRFAATLLTGAPADELRRHAAAINGQPLCSRYWRAGVLTPVGPAGPPDGARCSKQRHHEDWCSFIDDAVARGWEIPAHLQEIPLRERNQSR